MCIAENQHKEIIIIDEIDKMPKVRNTQTVKANIVIFAISDRTERLSKPLLSRFTVFEIPPYSYDKR